MPVPVPIIVVGCVVAVFVLKAVVPCVYWWHVGSGWDPRFTFPRIVGIRLRRVEVKTVIAAVREASAQGIGVELDACEAHYLAGGDVLNVVRGVVAARERGFGCDFTRAAAIDLAGRDVVEVVRRASSAEELNRLADDARDELMRQLVGTLGAAPGE